MKRALFILFLFLSIISLGQNYRCFDTGSKHYFINNQGYLRGVRVDSIVASGTDLVYYPFHTFRSLENDTAGSSWVGKAVVEKSDGTFLFNTMWRDTILIKTQAVVGESWTFYNDSSTKNYIATISAVDTMTVLGVLDSVKTITINAFSGSIPDTGDSVNNFSIKIGKNSGFIQVFDLYTFPYYRLGNFRTNDDYYRYYARYPSFLKSSEIFKIVDYKAPTLLDVYNFNPGDFFERKIDNSSLFYYLGGNYDQTSGTRIDSIISSNVIDSFHKSYTIYHRNREYDYDVSAYVVTADYDTSFIDTLLVDTTALFGLHKMPEEIRADNHYFVNRADYLYFYVPNGTGYCFNSNEYAILNPDDSYPVFTYRSHFKTGFVQTYKEVDYWGYYTAGWENYIVNRIYTELVYSRKGGVSCGTYVPPLSTNDVMADATGFKISPNPANDNFVIQSSSSVSYSVTLTNVIGDVVLRINSVNETQIATKSLPSGMYYVTISDEKGFKYNEKLVILH